MRQRISHISRLLLVVSAVLVCQGAVAQPSPSAFLLREGKARREVSHGSRGTDKWSITPFKRWLYDGSRKLGRIEYVSISPSGRFALFEFNRRLTLYDRRCVCRLYVDKSYDAYPDRAIWDEDAGSLRVPGTMLVSPYDVVVEIALPTGERPETSLKRAGNGGNRVTDTVDCDLHGEQPETFVCQHIANSLHTGRPVGFFWSQDADEPRPDAWCAECDERAKKTGGEWVGEAAEHLSAQLLCGECYDNVKRLCLEGGQ